MLTKLAALIKGKAALAVLGVLLVGGGGATVAASHGQLKALGQQLGAQSTAHPNASGNGHDGSHIEGILSACDSTAGTIRVTDQQGKAYTYIVNTATTFVGDTHAHGSNSDTGATTAFGLTQLCALTDQVKVQVQATLSVSGSASTLTANKITVEGPDSGASGSDNGAGSDARPSVTPGAKPSGTPSARGV